MLHNNSAVCGSAHSNWQLMMVLFDQMSALPAHHRHRFLEAQCIEPEMRNQLLKMMESLELTGSILDKSIFMRAKHRPQWQARNWIGQQLDQFTITDIISEGGMGVVFKAQQQEPVQRHVAIKLIKQGAPNQFTEHFRFEQSALAQLNHPNIATIHTVGHTSDRSPYLVMEYIQGQTILHHCDQYGLSVSARLNLFLQVCDAISFCHQRGIMHRDIKPSNVLIRRLSSGDIPIIIDFGIAVQQNPDIRTPRSASELNGMGTPEYMSPEHLQDVSQMDTRADVYSLGCLLFSLLVGKASFESTVFDAASRNEKKAMIRAFNPGTPRQYAMAMTNAEQETQAHNCGDSVPGWLAQLDEELDWIYQKATAKNRVQRYGSVSELVSDIRRYFCHEPVQAKSHGCVYLLKKFTQRHKAFSVSLSVVFTTTLLFLGILLLQYQQIKTEFTRAEAQRTIAEQVSELLTDIFSAADPYQSQQEPQTVLEVLNKGLTTLQADKSLTADIRYNILLKLAEVYTNLAQHQQAIAIAHDILGRHRYSNIETDVRAHLVIAESNELAGQYQQALAHANIVYELAKTRQIDRSWMARTTIKLSSYHAFNNDFHKALEMAREAVVVNSELYGRAHVETARALKELGLILEELEQLEEAGQVLREAMIIYRNQRHPNDLELSNVIMLQGLVLHKNGKHAEAAVTMEKAVANLQQHLGNAHPDYIAALNNLTTTYAATNQWAKALDNMQQVSNGMLLSAGESSKAFLITRLNLGVPLLKLGRYKEAHQNWLETLDLAKKYAPEDTFISGEIHRWLAALFLQQGEYRTAQHHGSESVRLLKKTFATPHSKTSYALLNLAIAEAELQQFNLSGNTALEAITYIDALSESAGSANLNSENWRLTVANAVRAYAQFKQTGKPEYKQQLALAFKELRQTDNVNALYVSKVQQWLPGSQSL